MCEAPIIIIIIIITTYGRGRPSGDRLVGYPGRPQGGNQFHPHGGICSSVGLSMAGVLLRGKNRH